MTYEINFLGFITSELDHPSDNTPEAFAIALLSGHLAENCSDMNDLSQYLRDGLVQIEYWKESTNAAIEKIKDERSTDPNNGRFFMDVIAELRKWKRLVKEVDKQEFLIALAKDWQECMERN